MRPSAILWPDSGPRAGMGHTSRCIALGRALVEDGWRVTVVAEDPAARRRAREHGLRAVANASGRCDVAVVDTYRQPLRWIRRARRVCTIVAGVDDLHQLRSSDVDLIIRPSIGERCGKRLVGGAAFVMLTPFFARVAGSARRRSRSVHRIVISIGSYPPAGLDERLRTIASHVIARAQVTVASGVAGGRLVPLADLLTRADLAIISGGQTLNEVIALGLPAIVLTTATNQERQIRAAARSGAIIAVGGPDARGFETRLRRALVSLDRDPGTRRRLATAAVRLLDGRGALRVGRVLEEALARRTPVAQSIMSRRTGRMTK